MYSIHLRSSYVAVQLVMRGGLLPEVVHILKDLEAPGRQQGQAVALDPEVAPAVRRVGHGPEPLEDLFPVRGIEQGQVDLPVVAPAEPREERAVIDVLACLIGVERLLLVQEGGDSESELGVSERCIHAAYRPTMVAVARAAMRG